MADDSAEDMEGLCPVVALHELLSLDRPLTSDKDLMAPILFLRGITTWEPNKDIVAERESHL